MKNDTIASVPHTDTPHTDTPHTDTHTNTDTDRQTDTHTRTHACLYITNINIWKKYEWLLLRNNLQPLF